MRLLTTSHVLPGVHWCTLTITHLFILTCRILSSWTKGKPYDLSVYFLKRGKNLKHVSPTFWRSAQFEKSPVWGEMLTKGPNFFRFIPIWACHLATVIVSNFIARYDVWRDHQSQWNEHVTSSLQKERAWKNPCSNETQTLDVCDCTMYCQTTCAV